MTHRPEHIRGRTFHGRRGAVANRFSYGVDYIVVDPEAAAAGPRLYARNRANVTALHDSDHGGPPGAGRGAAWLRAVLAAQGLGAVDGQVLLVAQPRVFGHVFNPVSFWLCHDAGGVLRVVVAEVTNTYGDRHSYLCHHDGLAAIGPDAWLAARKLMHVSPFQPVEGGYRFRFDIRPERLDIVIDYRHGEGGVVATLSGTRAPLTDRAILGALLRRPFGSRRVLGLIHWQALRLWAKSARFMRRPKPPADEVSR